MFERFTERARQVVVLAQDEARALKHNYIGTEHILLGLLREEEGLAARVLESLDITVEEVRAQVARIVGQGDEVTTGQIPFTPRAKKVLELALREALSLGHNYIGTEHILLGLVRENEGVAARILLDFDADAEKIRNEIIRMLSGPGRRQQGGSAGAPARSRRARSCSTSSGATSPSRPPRESSIPSSAGRRRSSAIMQILSRRQKNNPVLIGEPGVGKTAIVEGLAQRISGNQVPELLKGKQIYSLDLAALVAGSKYRGEFEERLKKVMKEIQQRATSSCSVSNRQLHNLVGARPRARSRRCDLKAPLAVANYETIGATTLDGAPQVPRARRRRLGAPLPPAGAHRPGRSSTTVPRSCARRNRSRRTTTARSPSGPARRCDAGQPLCKALPSKAINLMNKASCHAQ